MRKIIAAAALMAIATPAALPTAAVAQDRDWRDRDQDRGRDRGDWHDNGRHRGWRNNDRAWRGDRDGDWDPARHYRNGSYSERRLGPNDRIYRGSDGRYYCKRSNGTTGLVLGAVGGGVLGNVLGGGTLGTLLGAGGGALLGKNLDQKHDRAQNERNGYRCR